MRARTCSWAISRRPAIRRARRPGEKTGTHTHSWEKRGHTHSSDHEAGYDLNGNLLSDGLRGFTYSSENQLLTATTLTGGEADYSYGPAARRVRKSVDGVGTDYLHAGNMD